MKSNKCIMISSLLLASVSAMANPARIYHQTASTSIVRMDASDGQVVWQEVGDQGSERYLYTLDIRSGKKDRIDAGRRPFGPQVSKGVAIYGAGRINTGVVVDMHDLATKKTTRLQGDMGWISEPAIDVFKNAEGTEVVRAVWDWSKDIFGKGMEIVVFEGSRNGVGTKKVLAKGPIELRESIPPEYHESILSEYPELSGESMIFQNTEYGVPNVYRMDLKTGNVKRLSPSIFYQERPHIDGRYSAWEESERGFGVSNISSVFMHDNETGEVKMINAGPGFHYQVRISGNYVLYGAKRDPLPSTPSLRVYDIAKNVEYDASKCFAGSIFDWSGIESGLFAAQRMAGGSSRLLFATWEQLKNGCK